MCLCSKQSCLFSFYALPSGGKSKDMVVHYAEKCKQRGAREEMEKSVPLGFHTFCDIVHSMLVGTLAS